MAQTGYTPIQIYYSPTTTNVPLAANLATGELAINAADGKLFYKDTSNVVQVIGWKVTPATAGGTGQSVYTVGDVLYASTSSVLSKLADVATGNALISGGVGVAPSYGKIGLATHVSGILPLANGGLGNSTADGSVLTGIPLPRMVVIANATSVTLNATTTDIGTQVNTQATGTLTINAPTGTPVNGQKIIFRLTSTNVQTFSWNAIFVAGSTVTLPVVSSGSGRTDYMGFLYNSTTAKWQLLASSFGYA